MAKKGRAALDREKDMKEQKHIPPSSSSSSSSSSSILPDSSAMDRDITTGEFVDEKPGAEAIERDVRNGSDPADTAGGVRCRIELREEDSAEKDGVQGEAVPQSPSKTISLSLPVTLSPTATAAAAAAAAAELESQKEDAQESEAAEPSEQDVKTETAKEEPESEEEPAVVTCIRATDTSMPTITCNVRTPYSPYSFLACNTAPSV